MPPPHMPRLIVVMGVAGAGKSRIAAALAEALSAQYIDGDDFHPKANIAKMSRGEPLTDTDRWPWLETIGQAFGAAEGQLIIACSALKRIYRDRIAEAAGAPIFYVYLDGNRELIAQRMADRDGHFMPTSLLDSQFEALEIPGDGEWTLSVDISGTVEEIVSEICVHLPPDG